MVRHYSIYLPHVATTYRQQIALIPEAGFKFAELQAEFWETSRSKTGRVYAPDNTPPAFYLTQQGVECWAYVSPFWLLSEAALGGLRDTGHDDDPYWFKRTLTREVAEHNWWLRDKEGNVCLGMQMYPLADITNDACRDFIVDALVKHESPRLRFDNGMVRQHSYIRPFQTRVSHDALFAAHIDIYRRVRGAGKQVVVNGGWEMFDPDDKPWVFPLYDMVDGVMIEWPTGFANDPWWSLKQEHLYDLAQGWAGKKVILVAAYNKTGYKRSQFGSYQEHARAFAAIAEQYGWWFATGREEGNNSMFSQVWNPNDWLPSEAERPTTILERLLVLEEWRIRVDARLAALAQQALFHNALSKQQTAPGDSETPVN